MKLSYQAVIKNVNNFNTTKKMHAYSLEKLLVQSFNRTIII